MFCFVSLIRFKTFHRLCKTFGDIETHCKRFKSIVSCNTSKTFQKLAIAMNVLHKL